MILSHHFRQIRTRTVRGVESKGWDDAQPAILGSISESV